MSADANSVDVKPLEPEELAVVELFLSFDVSLDTASVFLENGYRLETLKIIQRKEMEELFQPPFLADRTKCLNGLSAWRLEQGIPAISCCKHPAAAQPASGAHPAAVQHPAAALHPAAAPHPAAAQHPSAAQHPAAALHPAAPEVSREQCNATIFNGKEYFRHCNFSLVE
ncbi:uncharacterized protein LOC119767521 [Culex quinquefasciatus]|uniref:uncharacterized protein LOC119767521 n=1 Tax=Culex quinquefasciatus TaxID=7176 RepID=UPI0018E2972A|nr:uncharacterized protein LOC119767521 [Culex quinquefasciatus]